MIRKLLLAVRLLALVFPVFAGASAGVQAADLEIEVTGIKARTGTIHAALFANADDFSVDLAFHAMITKEGGVAVGVFTKEGHMPRPPAERASAPASSATVRLRMSEVPPGAYALALYQDVNDDGKLDTNFDGHPLEPWGMSNNPHFAGRRLTWDDAQFVLPAEGARLVIELQFR